MYEYVYKLLDSKSTDWWGEWDWSWPDIPGIPIVPGYPGIQVDVLWPIKPTQVLFWSNDSSHSNSTLKL